MYTKTNKNSIKKLFNYISDNYDYMNDIMSFGLHRIIKKISVKKLPQSPSFGVIIDLACGTGDTTRILAKKYSKAKIIGIDFSKKMLAIAKKRSKKYKNIEYIQHDITKINELFDENSVTICTISFGLRNLPNIEIYLKKIHKILIKNGIVSILDLGHPNRLIERPYNLFFYKLIPLLGRIFTKKGNPYLYLTRSLKIYPNQKRIIKTLRKTKFKIPKNYNYFGGIMAQQIGIK